MRPLVPSRSRLHSEQRSDGCAQPLGPADPPNAPGPLLLRAKPAPAPPVPSPAARRAPHCPFLPPTARPFLSGLTQSPFLRDDCPEAQRLPASHRPRSPWLGNACPFISTRSPRPASSGWDVTSLWGPGPRPQWGPRTQMMWPRSSCSVSKGTDGPDRVIVLFARPAPAKLWGHPQPLRPQPNVWGPPPCRPSAVLLPGHGRRWPAPTPRSRTCSLPSPRPSGSCCQPSAPCASGRGDCRTDRLKSTFLAAARVHCTAQGPTGPGGRHWRAGTGDTRLLVAEHPGQTWGCV